MKSTGRVKGHLMTRRNLDPDLTRRDDGAYWAAALVLAIRAGDIARADTARQNLRRLGYRVDLTQEQARKAVRHDR